MRIVLVAPPWISVPPPAYGGTELVIDTLARGLAAAGHDVVLATTGDSTCPVERTWTHPRARTADMGDVAVELRHVLHAYEQVSGADVVHDHTTAGPLYGARRTSLPVVTTNHTLFSDDMRAIYRALDGRVPVIAISHHHATTARDVPVARVIHHGLDLDGIPVGPGGDHLAFVGRMDPSKGVREAIEIARRADAPLVIAAKMRSRAERDYFDAQIKPLLGGPIEYAGELDRPAALELLRSARALLNPIQWDEPFGLVMVEALASGTPVITSPRGAAPEIVDHGTTGFLAATLEQAVAAVSWSAGIDRRACRKAAEARFSADRMVADHLALYHDVLAGRLVRAANSRGRDAVVALPGGVTSLSS